MYAYLRFPSNVAVAEAVRDITRLITESNDGAASLSTLEFADTANSTLYAGTNSGWSLLSYRTINSGALVSDGFPGEGYTGDHYYILQGTTAGGKTKYCGIRGNGRYDKYNDTNNFGVLLSGVADPNTANENWSAGYESTSSTYGNYNCLDPRDSFGIHLWAEPRKIMMFGVVKAVNEKGFCMHLESDETTMTEAEDLSPVANIFMTSNSIDTGNEYVGWAAGSGHWIDTEQFPYIQFIQSAYSNNPNMQGNIRNLSFRPNQSHTNDFLYFSTWMEDGTKNGSSNTTAGQGGTATYSNCITFNPRGFFGPHGLNTYFSNSTYSHQWNTYGGANAVNYDSSGNPALPRIPLSWTMPPQFSWDTYDFSSVSKVWKAPSSLGQTGDEFTIGGTTYQYISLEGVMPLGGYVVEKI